MRGAPGGDRPRAAAELDRLRRQDAAEVDMGRSTPAGLTQFLHDFRTYFIAGTANAYPTVHYDVTCRGECVPLQDVDAPLENPAGRAAPAGMEESDGTFGGHGAVDRDGVRPR